MTRMRKRIKTILTRNTKMVTPIKLRTILTLTTLSTIMPDDERNADDAQWVETV